MNSGSAESADMREKKLTNTFGYLCARPSIHVIIDELNHEQHLRVATKAHLCSCTVHFQCMNTTNVNSNAKWFTISLRSAYECTLHRRRPRRLFITSPVVSMIGERCQHARLTYKQPHNTHTDTPNKY